MPEPFAAVHLDAVPPGPDRGAGIAEVEPVCRQSAPRRSARTRGRSRRGRGARHPPRRARRRTVRDRRTRGAVRGAAQPATFIVDGHEIDAPAGTLEDPDAVRSAVAAAPDAAVLGVGAPRGAPFRAAPWEQRDIEA